MFKSKYVFTFIITTFLLLSLVGAGIFVDDEWASAQQLKQLGSGNQIIFNEGTYGYYANGTSGIYFQFRENRFMYTLAFPIASLPVYEFIKLCGDYFRAIILLIWAIFGFLSIYYLYITKQLSLLSTQIWIAILTLLVCANIYLYTSFPTTGEFTPTEVLAIVTTNIILFGLFAVVLHKIIDQLFDTTRLKIFTFVTILSCTSLIFWVGTCKDHILTVLLSITILYLLIRYEQQKSMLSLSIVLFLTGLITWVRIEVGVGMILAIGIYLLLFHYKQLFANKTMLLLSLAVGSIPFWINNYITTGSFFLHPYTKAFITFGSNPEAFLLATSVVISVNNDNIFWTIFHFFLSPSSGAIGLLILIPLAVIIIPAYIFKRVKLSRTDILLFIMTFGSSAYYIVQVARYMHADMGIMPDMRYFIFFYTCITLFSISILSKIMPELKYKKILIYYILSVGLLFILFTTYVATLSSNGTYRDLDRVVNTLSSICIGIGVIAVTNDIRLNKSYLTYILPLLIAIPMAWQLVMLFIYTTSKVHAYPMFIPTTEFLYNYIFGLIL